MQEVRGSIPRSSTSKTNQLQGDCPNEVMTAGRNFSFKDE
jgi:hypothetical protein